MMKANEYKTTLVAGGAGFIGSHLCDRLVKDGHKVLCMDNLYTGHIENVSNPIGIRSCYDEGKRCAESLCMDYHRQYSVQVKIIRVFNTYGPRMTKNDGRVISNFVTQALCGEDITIYGDGSQTRSFQYVDDLIEAMMRVVKTGNDFTGPINLGNSNEIAVRTLASLVMSLTKSHSKIISRSLPNNDPRRRCPDISLATQLLNGWKPNVKIEDGLSMTIEYFRKECL
jgi:NAD-dependent epimerase/dehydratase family protein